MKKTTQLEDYTESEFLDFLRELLDGGEDLVSGAYDNFIVERVEHFGVITQHPDGSDLIFYPKEGQEVSPEGILKTVKEWRAANNKPGFKQE